MATMNITDGSSLSPNACELIGLVEQALGDTEQFFCNKVMRNVPGQPGAYEGVFANAYVKVDFSGVFVVNSISIEREGVVVDVDSSGEREMSFSASPQRPRTQLGYEYQR